MRQIKFRGLLTSTQQWIIGDLYQDGYSGKTFITEFIGIESGESITELREVIPESVGQFTGLHDKNGVEIYEGDVVKFSTRRYHLGRDKGLQTITFKSDVIFDDGCFMISETQKYDTYLYTHSSECQVIGNIHTQDGGQDV